MYYLLYLVHTRQYEMYVHFYKDGITTRHELIRLYLYMYMSTFMSICYLFQQVR